MASTGDSQTQPDAQSAETPHPRPTGLKRQFFWSMIPLLVISVVNLVSVRLFYRYLGAEMYALWFYVITLTGSFGFIDMGLGTAVARNVGIAIGAGDMKAAREYWGTGNAMIIPVLLLMSLVFMAIGVAFGPKWFQVSSENVRMLRWAFVAGGFGLFFAYYSTFWLSLSQAHLDFKFIGVVRSIVNLVQVLAALGLAFLTSNPVILVGVGALASLAQLVIFAWHARRKYHIGFNLGDASMARAREMMGMSGKIFAMILIDAFGSNMDRLFLGRLSPPAVFAHYTISYNLGARIRQLGGSIMGPVFNQTNRALGSGNAGSTAAIYNETFNFTFGFYALGAIWTTLWHPLFLRLWLGQELALQVAPAFTPVVIAFCLSGVGLISAAQLVPLNRAGTQMCFAVVNSIGMGLGAIAGWHWGGLGGVGWGLLASRLVTVTQDLYVIRMIGGGGWLAMRTWLHLLGQIAFGCAFFLPTLLLPESSYWKVATAALHGGLVGAWLLRHQLRKFLATAFAESKA
jgi:O-antigen/teichoic acid export membrane protein